MNWSDVKIFFWRNYTATLINVLKLSEYQQEMKVYSNPKNLVLDAYARSEEATHAVQQLSFMFLSVNQSGTIKFNFQSSQKFVYFSR